ncbi:MAG: cache domain-containing protein [Bacteriovorax sp.]
MPQQEGSMEIHANGLKPQAEKVVVTRANQRRKFSVHGNPIKYQEITPPGTKSMAMYTVVSAPGESTGTKLLHHGGDETLLVLSGTFELELEDRNEKLGPGDSAFIPRGELHRLTNIGIDSGEGVFVLSPPEYTDREHLHESVVSPMTDDYSLAKTYEFKETHDLVALVNHAAKLVQTKGESCFGAFRESGSKWRQKETYIFVLDPEGNMLVHPDPALAGINTIDLKDVNGRPIIRGLVDAATSRPDKPDGWYHYEWPVPNEILPRWKSSYVRLVKAATGKNYIVGSGVYNNRMEKSFVIDMVKDAVALIEEKGKKAFPLFHDKKDRFMAKDAYIFVVDPNGVELVHPAHPNLEGRNVLDMKDHNGVFLFREMFKVIQTKGFGWVNYMWPKPGDSVPTQKSTYVMKAKLGDQWLLVGCGVYLSDAPKASFALTDMTAPKLMELVREGATLLEKKGAAAYPEFRKKGSKWFKDDTYFFIWDMNGTRKLHAADPTLEGLDGRNSEDINGRPYGKMFLEIAKGPTGEGWVHYMYPEPGQIFPAWKSLFLKRATLSSGEKQLIGCGIYHMQMDKTMIEDVVNRACDLVKEKGKAAFDELRNKKGPFYFMDTYVFVDTPDGMEVVNPGAPYLEGKNIADLKDAKGKALARDYIKAAMDNGEKWVEYYWYKPGSNDPTLKKTFVRKVQSGNDIYIVGSGYYIEEQSKAQEKLH